MLVAAVLVPATPLLLSGYVGAEDAVPELREAVRAAAAKAAAGADRIVLVAGNDGYATSPETGRPEGSTTVEVGLRLLQDAGIGLPVSVETIGFDVAPRDAVAVGERLAAVAGRVLLLVVGDGSARHLASAPGALDERAAPFDAAVAQLLDAADAAGLRDLDVALADDLMVAGRSAWQVLAGALPQATGELHWTGAPYGVGYHVATWTP